MNGTITWHQHSYAARQHGKARNRWDVYCPECHRVIIPDLSEQGAHTMVEEMRGNVCKVPGCGKPVYVNVEGIGAQKPYRAALCVEHICKNFEAIGILPPMIEGEVA